ncbi:non-ribosomal peptide synthetase [Acanthopleuribacter pedis]|uniref:AMP-binding protein n=1 Tax=Acanthopleuribacter pedis TaxID=442870 RepID=A0A8J7QE94_9BACT|nr:AMP-binding protein [Acanthopleuribacter pedis]MBO1322992.1 AMP-binding protein [Acanthopleuribacter pedis]
MSEPHFCDAYAAVVKQNGRRPALLWRGQTLLNHAGLWRAAAGLSKVLQDHGAVPGQTLPLLVTHSPAWPVAVLGAWLADTAFSPIDRAQPETRRAAMLETLQKEQPTSPKIVLSCRDTPPYLCITVDNQTETPLDLNALSQAVTTAPARHTRLAYTVFTSGSTGRPKGVLVPHDGLVPMLRAQIDAFRLKPDSRALAYLPLCFDAALSDLGATLLAGAALVMEPADALPRDGELLTLIDKRAVTHADLPPAILPYLDPAAAPACLETVIYGGATCSESVVRRWASLCRLVVVYGPTEATICTSLEHIKPDQVLPGSIGRPLQHLRYRVCNENAAPVAAGTPGELWISGNQLSLGYLGDETQTTQRFRCIDQTRWYRTGDRVRREKDGRFVFLGRLDRQFKLGGRLIAPEEIERALMNLAEVREAVVFADEWDHLSAVFVAEQRLDGENLRRLLRDHLPEWMVPIKYVQHADLPRTTTGKPDFNKLRRRCREPKAESTPTKDAMTATDRWITWWGLVLDRKDIGPDTHFFNTGGSSLLALRLQAEAARSGTHLPLRTLYEHPTPRRLAAALTQPTRRTGGLSVAQLRTRLPRQAVPHHAAPRTHRAPAWLITGASGRLGTHLVPDLLRHTQADLLLLQHRRPAGPTDQRVTRVQGDYTQAYLGLDQVSYQDLTERVTAVVHLGALPHQSLDDETLWRNHVEGTKQITAFCAVAGARLVHASTLALFTATPGLQGRVSRDHAFANETRFANAYAATKWASEAVALAAGASVHNLRLGMLDAGDASHLVCRLMAGLIRFGVIPDPLPDLAFDLTPTAAATFLIRSCLTQPEGFEKILHLANHTPLTAAQLVRFLKVRGHRFEAVTKREYLARISEGIDGNRAKRDRSLPRGCDNQSPADPKHLVADALLRELAEARPNHENHLFCSTGLDYAVESTLSRLPGSIRWDAESLLLPLYQRIVPHIKEASK